MNPEILLLDEPSASLDSYNSGLIAEMMVELKKTCTVIAVTHNQELIEKTADIIFDVRPLSEKQGSSSSLFRI
jgi:phosphate transport system ATP-binding protein